MPTSFHTEYYTYFHQNGLMTVTLTINPFMISPCYIYSGWGVWEMCVIAKSNRLQQITASSQFCIRMIVQFNEKTFCIPPSH